MTDQTFNVEPIWIGINSNIQIDYPAAAVAAYPILTGRILAHFKHDLTQSTPTMVIDSDVNPASVERAAIADGGVRLTLKLTAVQTALLNVKRTNVLFDILHYVSGSPSRLPDLWTWPIQKPVTTP